MKSYWAVVDKDDAINLETITPWRSTTEKYLWDFKRIYPYNEWRVVKVRIEIVEDQE